MVAKIQLAATCAADHLKPANNRQPVNLYAHSILQYSRTPLKSRSVMETNANLAAEEC